MAGAGTAAYARGEGSSETGTFGIRVFRMLAMLTPSTGVERQAPFRTSGCSRGSIDGHCNEPEKEPGKVRRVFRKAHCGEFRGPLASA